MKKGKILYINQYFKHPAEPGITRSYWIAKELINRGYEVVMLAHRNELLDHVKNVKPVEITNIDGIKVIYIKNKYSNDMGVVKRAISFVNFMIRSTKYAYKEKDVDLVIATSTPLTVAFPALIRKWFKKTPFVFEVRDLWPEAPIQMGAIKNKILIKFLRWFEKITYKNALHVVALSPGMLDGVLKYVPKENTSMIPNMAKIDKFWPREPNDKLIQSMGLRKDSFKAIYFGQMGLSNDLETILSTAIQLQKENDTNIEFVIIGHGSKYKKVQETIYYENLTNIKLFSRVPMSQMSEILNFCDVSLVMFSNIPILYTNSPNKLFDSLSAGKPIIVNSAGWTKIMVEEAECGLFVEPDNSELLKNALLDLKNNPALKSMMASNSRNLAEQKYDKSILCYQFGEMIDKLYLKS